MWLILLIYHFVQKLGIIPLIKYKEDLSKIRLIYTPLSFIKTKIISLNIHSIHEFYFILFDDLINTKEEYFALSI